MYVVTVVCVINSVLIGCLESIDRMKEGGIAFSATYASLVDFSQGIWKEKDMIEFIKVTRKSCLCNEKFFCDILKGKW